MIISETLVLQAPRERAAAFLLDVEAVRSCVPGVGEVTELSPGEYGAVMSVQIGPIRSSFAGSIKIDDSGAPELLAATATGKDKSSGSSAHVAFNARLTEASPATTTVETTADVTIRGRLGSFGTGVIQATAKQMLAEFVTCVDSRLTATEEAPAAPVAQRVPLLRILWLGLWERIRARRRSKRVRGENAER